MRIMDRLFADEFEEGEEVDETQGSGDSKELDATETVVS